MDSISDHSLEFEFGEPVIDDLEMGIMDASAPLSEHLAPGPGEAAALAPPKHRFGAELSQAIPTVNVSLPRQTKTIIAIAIGGAAGGFLIGGPIGATAGAVLGFLVA